MNEPPDRNVLQSKGCYYRYCFVTSCKNTTITAPDKVFVCVPKQEPKRRVWLTAAGYPASYTSTSGARYCCEDHLDLKNDIENYRELQFHGGGSKRLRDGVIPRFNMSKLDESTNSDEAAPTMETEDTTSDIGMDVKEENFDYTDDVLAKNGEYTVDNLSETGFAFVGVSLNGARVCDPTDEGATREKWTQTEEKTYESKHVQAKPETRVKTQQTLRSTRDKCV